jgi:hypothetical protein
MARLFGYFIPIPHVRGRALMRKRALAVATIVVLLVGTVAPSWAAAAAEADTEGEGMASPGLENPHFDPGGEEFSLEVLPDSSANAEAVEEAGEGSPIETEPAQEPELPEPAPAAEEAAPPVAVPEAVAPPAESASQAAPEYTPAAPEYSPPAPSSTLVENEPIVAPPSASEPPPGAEASPPEPEATAPEAVTQAPPAVVPSSEPEAPAQEAPPQAPAPAAVPGSGGVSPPLLGRTSYTVRRGDCLWSIAEALLPSGAGNEEISAEVARLWNLNADRIGTGDTNLILAGTQLALG